MMMQRKFAPGILVVTGGVVMMVSANLLPILFNTREESEEAVEATTAKDQCIVDWEDLRIIGRYGTIEVANRSDREQEVLIMTIGGKLSLQAKLEPRRGVRLRSSIDAIKDEPDDIRWVVTKKNGASREFSFAGCDRAIADLAPNIEDVFK